VKGGIAVLFAGCCLTSHALGQGVGSYKPWFSLKPGATYSYRVVVTQTEFEGSGAKVTRSSVSEMPISILVLDAFTVEVTSGPLFALGRSVGRARISKMKLDGPALLSWLYVPTPPKGTKPGQEWMGGLSAPAPVPAGIQARYKYLAPTAKQPFGQVDVSASRNADSRLLATGKLFVDPITRIPHHGKVLFQMTYERPDMKDRTKMVVNSHMTVECVVKPK